MLSRKIKLGYNWPYIAVVYVIVLSIAFYGVMVTADEYSGGNPFAEFGADLSPYFLFPLIGPWIQLTGGEYASRYDTVVKAVLVVNLGINFLITTMIVDKSYRWIQTKLVRR